MTVYISSRIIQHVDSGYSIDKTPDDRYDCDVGEQVFLSFSEAKKHVLKDIDNEIAFLRREKRRISAIKKVDIK